MTEKKKKKVKDEEKGRWHDGLKEETKYSVWGIICFGISLFLVLAIFHKAGMAGDYANYLLKLLLGEAIFLAPAIFFFAAVSLFASFRPNLLISSLIGGALLFVSSLALVEVIFSNKTGGYIGFLMALPFLKLIDYWASLILFSAIFIIGILIMFNFSFSLAFLKRKSRENTLLLDEDKKISESLENNLEQIKEESQTKKGEKTKQDSMISPAVAATATTAGVGLTGKRLESRKFKGYKFEPPSLELLEGDKGTPSGGDIKANANVIKRTLQNFGIEVAMDEVRIGPSVTQFSLKPAEGVKLTRITALNNDLALALASHPIRIEAPIPGKSLVGIEVPNQSVSLVGLKHLLKEDEFQKADKPLVLALGRNVAGKPVYSSLTKMPHLLVAGATGSGKSVAIHALIMSMLYRHPPWELKLLLIDPKRVELTMYGDLPYLLSPVITDAKKAIIALKWATREMEKRYDLLLKTGVRDIATYHQKRKDESMPYIVIIIDELADVMATYPREFESSIVRLAQMSRAVGIHLIVSTQRPSVEVITGLIKANITSRIAFQVASQVDSRTILDMAGAERLLGNGDMLYLSGDASKPKRIQGSFVSENEVRQVADCLTEQYRDLDLDEENLVNGEIQQSSILDEDVEEYQEDEDELYEQAREMVIQAGRASSSYLQRRLRIGYARAARLLDMLEEREVVGPPDGARPRDILVEKGEQEY